MAYTVAKLADYSPAALDEAVRELLSAVRQEGEAISGEGDWKDFRDRWMARKSGILTQINDLWLKAAPAPAKREVGARVNQLKVDVEQTVVSAQQRIGGSTSAGRLDSGRLHVNPPGIRRPLAAEHPVAQPTTQNI